ncbi:hypothetical protein THARTR1_10631 [Trichoderma harzianum]|uniref:F-box domain-containing protein n=1 Tax=Trichoderma harzianum TaxID=5544 RepID=A0A2K0TNL6_TRIHA|nr:hypothetical protein THARTR1_10631 [Trichoderma harzianum]
MESVTRLSLNPWVICDFDLGQMGDYLAMMPCLERLKVIDCAKVTQKLPLASLRSLTFHYSDHSDGHMEENSLQNIVDSCPKLEHLDLGFTWRMEGSGAAAGSEPLTWSQAQRILHPRRETLKHLKLEFNKTPWGFTSPRPVRQEEYLSSFREFKALESLWVRTVGFGSKENLGKAPTFPENVQHLVGMLPESLTRICFCGTHPEWDGLLVLAKAISEGHLPKLKKVMVEDVPYIESDQSGYEELSTALGACVEILEDMEDEVEVDDIWKQYTTAAYQ